MDHSIRKAAVVACVVIAAAAGARPLSRVMTEMLARRPHSVAVSPASPSIAAAASGAGDLVEQAGSAPKLVPISLALHGDVAGIPDATPIDSVDIAVGSEHVGASVSGRTFVATTPWMRPGEMASVTVTANGIKYRSLLGSMARLKVLSGGDGVVTVGEAPALHVDPMSTAFAVLERANLGSRDPSSDAEFEDTLQQFLGYDVGVTAYMLDRYARGAAPLPAGYATGFDVVSDPDRFSSEVDPLTYNDHYYWPAAVTSYVAALPVSAPLSRMDELPTRSLAVSGHAKDQLTMNAYGFWLERRDDGRFNYVDATPVADIRYDAALTGGALGLAPVTPTAQRRTDTTSFSPATPVTIDRWLDRVEWRRMIDGQRVDYWAVVYHWTDSYPDYPAQLPVSAVTVEMIGSTDLAPMIRGDAWADMPGRRQTLPVRCLDAAPAYTLSACDTAMHRFDPGGTGMTEDVGYKVDTYMQPQPGRYGSPFQWTTNPDGSLLVRYSDGSTTAWSTGSIPGIDSIVYTVTRTSGSVSRTALGLAITVRATTVPFDAPKAAGMWQSGMVLAYASTYPPDHSSIVWTRNADGTGEEANTLFADTTHLPQWWSVIGERLYERRTRARMGDGSLRWVSDCAAAQAAGATQCAPWRVRYLRPLRRVGNRLYGIEEIHLQTQLKPIGYTGAYAVTSSSRASYHQCDSGDCASYNASGPGLQYLAPVARAATAIEPPRSIRSPATLDRWVRRR